MTTMLVIIDDYGDDNYDNDDESDDNDDTEAAHNNVFCSSGLTYPCIVCIFR